MNKLIICGRLTRDPETRSGNGTAIARYSLAVDRRFKREGQPDADFFNCTAFGKGAEFAEKYLRKGTKIIVTGRIESDNYTDKNGNKVYSWNVVVEEQEFAESKNASGATETTEATSNGDGFVEVPDNIEDLPFI